jgi:hypothetical protein
MANNLFDLLMKKQQSNQQSNNSLLGLLSQRLQNQDYTPAPYNYGYRYGTQNDRKGVGYFGELPHKNGGFSTEISIGTDLGNGEQEIPSLVPTLTRKEIDHLLSGRPPTDAIVQKATDHAMYRISQGLSPFASYGEQRPAP